MRHLRRNLLTLLIASIASFPLIGAAEQSPSHVGVVVPKRILADKNGNKVFAMPVLPKEVKPAPRTSRPIKAVERKKGQAAFLEKAARERNAKALKRKAQATQYKSPSPEFLEFFEDSRIAVFGGIELLSSTVRTLLEKYPTCKKISSNPEEGTGVIFCSNIEKVGKFENHPFGNGLLSIYWKFLLANDVLIGADFDFDEKSLAREKFVTLANHPRIARKCFTSLGGDELDSPMWHITTGKGKRSFWTRIETNFSESKYIDNEKEKAKAEKVKLGSVLQIGVTEMKDMPETSEACRILGIDDEKNVYEYYGQCLGFPGKAHYQLNFTEESKLESLVLRPRSAGLANDLSEYLEERFGTGRRCHHSFGNVVSVLQKDETEALSFKFRYGRPVITNAVVYAGTCDRPFVYEWNGRFFFTNRNLGQSAIEIAFEKRLAMHNARLARQEERKARKTKIKGYFE